MTNEWQRSSGMHRRMQCVCFVRNSSVGSVHGSATTGRAMCDVMQWQTKNET